MIRDHERNAVVSVPVAPQLPHCPTHPQQPFHRDCAERDQYFGLNNFDLFHQIRSAGLHFNRRGCAISKCARRRIRSALKDVCDVDVFAREVHRLENFRQQLSGTSDKWFTLFVLVDAWRLADEHQISVGISHAEYGLCARTGEMRAFRTSANTRAYRLE